MAALSRHKGTGPAWAMNRLLAGLALALLLLGSGCSEAPLGLILDTDMSTDVDDVGALAVLHRLAGEEGLPILAVQVSSGDPAAPGCIRVLNDYLGRTDIPIGQVRGPSVIDRSRYTDEIVKQFAKSGSSPSTSDALALYRQKLAESPDGSVIIISIGYLTNLANLLSSPGDSFSPLPGAELVARKVKRLVTMGGEYPKGREWNFYQDVPAAAAVLQHWPTEIIFCGFESGKAVLTGRVYAAEPAANPFRRSYELYNGLTDRPSWDQLTVLYAIKGARKKADGLADLFTVVRGINVLDADGSNSWQYDQDGRHFYVRNGRSAGQLGTLLSGYMRVSPGQGGR